MKKILSLVFLCLFALFLSTSSLHLSNMMEGHGEMNDASCLTHCIGAYAVFVSVTAVSAVTTIFSAFVLIFWSRAVLYLSQKKSLMRLWARKWDPIVLLRRSQMLSVIVMRN